MIMTMLHSALFHGLLAGVGGAALVDVHAFLTWKKIQEAATYDWGTALLRWSQGAVSGALIGAGLGAYLS